MSEQFIYWMELADYDMETARAMQNSGRFLYVGFMCQQTIEKALKAVIAKDSVQPPRTHHLIKLASDAALFEEMSEQQQDLLFLLNPLNVEARYQSYKDAVAAGLNEAKCAELIGETEVLLCWIKTQSQS